MHRHPRHLVRFSFVVLAMLLPVGCSEQPTTPPTTPPQPTTTQSEPLPRELSNAIQAIGRGRSDDARAMAAAFNDAHPDDGRGHFVIAYSYHARGNHQPALPHFEDAVRLSPNFATARHFYGECLFLLGDLEGSRRQHEAHRTLDPVEPDPIYGLGLVDLEDGDLDAAEARFREALGLYEALKRANPRVYDRRAAGRARCHARLADIHFARDDYEAARDALLDTTRISPGTISALYTLSVVYRRLGEDDLADQTLTQYEQAREAIIRRRQGGDG